MTRSRAPWRRLTRPLVGVAVSLAFIAATMARVDLGLLGEAWDRVSLPLVALAALASFAEVGIRAIRWALLLRPMTELRFGTALAYLAIGHLANAVLPARLGDLLRALLAGGRLGVSRLTVLGTVAVERIADAGLLALVAATVVAVGYADLLPTLGIVAIVAAVCLILVVVATIILGSETVIATRVGAFLTDHALRFSAGAAALRRPASLAAIVVLTLTSFAFATLIMLVLASASGLSLQAWQAAVVIAAVTLSTAIPAGPASLGTYEFVGVTVMGSMGYPAEPSLLAVFLVHVVATLVPSGMGLVAMWAMRLERLIPEARSAEQTDEGSPTPAEAGQDPRATLSVVVPAHNSGDLLERTVGELAARLTGRQAEIIVVENGSSDDTWDRCVALADGWRGAGVALQCLRSEKGMGNALRAGVVASTGDRVLLTADDLPFGFDDLDALERLTDAGGPIPAVLIGSKAHPDSVVERGHLRPLLTRVFALLRRIVLGMRTGDPQGTLIIDGPLARELVRTAVEPGFLFTTELVHMAEARALRPLEVPVRLRASHAAHPSRISVGDMVSMALGLLALRARHRRDRSHRAASATRPAER